MTEKASPELFTCPGLFDGGRVAVQLTDGTLVEGYWYGGALHDEPRESSAYTLDAVFSPRNPFALKLDTPFWPNRPPAPWRIRRSDDGQWVIEQRLTDSWEAHRHCTSGPDAFATFAAGGAR